MEFVADPTEQQLAEIARGLNEYNAGAASVRSVARVRAVYTDPGNVVAGVDAAAYWGKSTCGYCGYIPATSPKVSGAV